MSHEFDSAVAGDVLERLEVVVLVREPADGGWRLASGEPGPGWWVTWFGSAGEAVGRSAFLEDFVERASRECWSGTGPGTLRSGMWEETHAGGESRFFEAIAGHRPSGAGDWLAVQAVDDRLLREQAILQSVHDQRLDRRRLQKELEKKQILLECIMHDLGNPLATVLMNLQHLGRHLGERPDLLPAVSRAVSQAERQRSLIRSIAEVFAADLIGMPTGEPVDLVSVGAQTIAALAPQAAARGVTLCPFFGPALPVAAEPLHLSRVLENLLVNAIRHSPDGGNVSLSFDRQDGEAVCRVEDEGAGIDDALLPRLFRPFTQGSGEVGQSGLGLYFCRLTVEQWGGRIAARNRPGTAGACFEIKLPLATGAKPTPA